MTLHKIASLALAVVLLLAGMAMGRAISEELDELWGADITVRELLSRVSPDLLGEFPVESYDLAVLWGKDRGRAICRSEESPAGLGSEIWYECARLAYQVDTFAFEFFAYTSTTAAVPYLRVLVYLQEDYATKDMAQDACYTCFDVFAVGINFDCHGERYRALSYHWITFPTGYEPPGAFVVGRSNWVQRWD